MQTRSSLALAIAAACLIATAAAAAPIHDAASKGDLAAVKKLVKSKPSLVSAKDNTGATPLHYAVAGSRKSVAEFLLSNKANIEARKNDGVRPVHVAAAMGNLDVLELLVSKHADINAADSTGRTPLSIARSKGDSKVISFLLDHGAKDPATAPTPKSASPAPQPTGPVNAWDVDLGHLSASMVRALVDGKYSELTKHFDDNMKSVVTEDKLAALRSQIAAQFGTLNKVDTTKQTKQDAYDVILVTCTFAKSTVELQFTYNNKQQLSGFFVK